MNGNRKGDLAEILAVAWLWEQGYEVFRNVGCTGKADLVIIDPEKGYDELIAVDVKCVSYAKQQDGGYQPTANKPSAKNVERLLVDTDSNKVSWLLGDFA